ncbi:hypothetical protein PR249_00065 [Metamycoplasma hyosynoviae]|uniref:hypothetical protein n=4 Tax=Metamycoplasma hyosynoviae TaxID=29559 RepID=UPI0023585C2F|nr:hypothetical protein [Metamycoplasma hyosynoviae]MDC8900683.1 hypothetical protein [Metamycoplasma hyosynoviae]MDC8912199.1 hypothetical protein [Metamycoplasma hyosynoviae]MDD1372981.1 hypothetical protein [Metamycoplasma hyosynoviae]MDD1374835.1 hypothetical protein [Metamycoplasma hyosynoviae]
MNKTTKIILSTAIPVGVASILIPTIVVASLKSKVKKTEQERKLLNDLNLEVQDYLGKITNEVKDNNAQKYQELLELTSRIKNVINNKYLKKEDYKKQLLLLKEKFDSFKEKINPPRKNDTDENTDNTNKDNTNNKDIEKPNTGKNGENETPKESVDAYQELKTELEIVEKFFNSINGEKYMEIKTKSNKKLDEFKKILQNKNLKDIDYSNAKNELTNFLDLIKREISSKEKEKLLEDQLDENSKKELKKIDEKTILFKRNFSEIDNQEKYKDNILKELNEIKTKYKLDTPVTKTSIEIKYRNILLDEINNRYTKFKTILDTNETQKKDWLKQEIEKISAILVKNKVELSQLANVEQIQTYLKSVKEKITSISKNEIIQTGVTLLNISNILDISKKIYDIQKNLNSINFNNIIKNSPLKDNINFAINFQNLLITFNEKMKKLKDINEWTQNKYIEYFDAFLSISKFNLRIENEVSNLKKLLELIDRFNITKTKIENIYYNKDFKISEKEKNNVNLKIKKYIEEYIKTFYDLSSLNELTLKIDNVVKKVEEESKKSKISYIDDLEEKKNNLYNKLKKYEEIYDTKEFEKTFQELKSKYKSASIQLDKQSAISNLENFFIYYEDFIENLDNKVSEYITMLKRIENLANEYSEPKYSKIIAGISTLAKEIKDDKFRNIQNINTINFILTSLVKTINDSLQFIKKLPNDIETLKIQLNKLVQETNKSLNIEIIPQEIKTNYQKLVDEINKNITNNSNININDLINMIYIVNAYSTTFKNDFTILREDNIYSYISSNFPYDYLFEFINEYTIFQEKTNKQISSILSTLDDHKKTTSLKVIDGFILYLDLLNKKYKEKIDKYDDFFVKYNKKNEKLLLEINNFTNYENAVFNLTAMFTKHLIDFSYKYFENIPTKNINHLNDMEKDLDLLIKIVSENKTLTQ